MSNDDLLVLYRALMGGKADAFERLSAECRPRLVKILRKSHLDLPREMTIDAAIDALLFLFQYPERYDPEKGSLLNFLKAVADHKILDKLRKSRREKVEFVGGNVELALVEANTYREEAKEPDVWQDPEVLSDEFAARLAEILPDPKDRQIVALIGQGRTDTAQIAEVLDILHLPPEQQQAEAKRNRDRSLKKLQRRRDDFRRWNE